MTEDVENAQVLNLEDLYMDKTAILYYGKKIIGKVPIAPGRRSVFVWFDKKLKLKKVYWTKKIDKVGKIYYKVNFYEK